MAGVMYRVKKILFSICLGLFITKCTANDILGCGGFVKSHVPLDFSKIEIGLYTKEGSLKEKTECAPNNGYYFLPLYEKGEYILKVHPPPGWSFEPSKVELNVDGTHDQCSTGQDINFAFNGFGITGRVITAGQKEGPSGISVKLINDKGDTRKTVTMVGGDFHFTPVIPGKYIVEATHSRWKLHPSEAQVQVREGNTAIPLGALTVSGYDVRGSVMLSGPQPGPVPGVYVLLYSKEENPKFRVEGCQTALLQGVPDSPICFSETDSSGEFSFGLVPAGEYRLLALAKSPGKTVVTFNIRPDHVKFTVLHDSLYIDKAFEVSGFTVEGAVQTHAAGGALAGVRVALGGAPAARSDAAGRYALRDLRPGAYLLSFEHEQCEFDKMEMVVLPTGHVSAAPARPRAWRVCGAVRAPPGPHAPAAAAAPARRVALHAARDPAAAALALALADGPQGEWCTFLAPGVYTASVEVSEREKRDGLQYYPLSQKVSVAHGPVGGVEFSPLRARLSGAVTCLPEVACEGVPVTVRVLSPDGGYIGEPIVAYSKNGEYTVSDVPPGSVEVSVSGARLCWREARRNLAVAAATARVPAFVNTGLALTLHASHPLELDYESGAERGTLSVAAGASQACVRRAARYALTPRGCHLFEPPVLRVDTASEEPQVVHVAAVAHAVVVRVLSPAAADDLTFIIDVEGRPERRVGPVPPVALPDGGFVYEHTLYMKEGEAGTVRVGCGTLLVSPAGAQPVRAAAEGACGPPLVLRARAALTLAGRIEPPVEGVTVTLLSDDEELESAVTGAAGAYRFGPLDASRTYAVRAHKDSYVFSEPDERGVLRAHRLAELRVRVVDDADEAPLQGALVSVSGGSYRRNLVTGAAGAGAGAGAAEGGRLTFSSLAPADYYVKPLMKEYRFSPPHYMLTVVAGNTHTLTLRGTRVAWSGVGRVVSVGGAGVRGAALLAAPAAAGCAPEEATADTDGAFRVRGLLPNCVYTLQLKESAAPELAGLRLVNGPPTLEIKNGKDIENLRLIAIQPHQITDANVLVRTPNVEHYKTLRLKLALEASPTSPIFTTKLDHAGFNDHFNPGLMYVLPRLPADNKTYVLQLESTLSKSTHAYDEEAAYFNSDGRFKAFTFDFVPKVKSGEQELRHSSAALVPLLALLAAAWRARAALGARLGAWAARVRPAPAARPAPRREDLLDRASIDRIVGALDPPARAKRKLH